MRKVLLSVAAVATIGLILYEPARQDAKDPAPRENVHRVTGVAGGSAEKLAVPERRTLGQARGELFGAPTPPPQPVAASAAPSAPAVQVAPAMPYRFAGRVRKGAEEEYLISKGDLVFPVKEGDTIDGIYRVLAVKADGIELIYLPLGTNERITVSSALEVDAAPVASAAPPPRAIAVPAPAPPGDARPAQLRWDGPKQVHAGGSFSVALRVSTQEPLRAAPMLLRYAPGVLEPVEVKPGAFIGKGTFSYRVSADGSIFVGATAPSLAAPADAELVVVTFRPLKQGATAELSMTALNLQGNSGRAIAHEQLGAFRALIH